MKEEPEHRMAQAKPHALTESNKRAEAKANLQRALESMARLRRTIDRRPGRLSQMRKIAGR
jgi:ubiquinone biosynthesis protein UbiJ